MMPAPLHAAPSAGRLFLAVPLTPSARESIRQHLDRHLRSRPLPGRAVAPANWHLTLRFLGETATPTFTELRRRLDAAEWPAAFRLTFSGLGAFPRPDRGRVLWLGIAGGAADVALLAALAEAAAVGAGCAPERRAFNGHLTLSRLDPPADLGRLMATVPPLNLEMLVGEVVLFRSHLGPGPAMYEAVAQWTLG